MLCYFTTIKKKKPLKNHYLLSSSFMDTEATTNAKGPFIIESYLHEIEVISTGDRQTRKKKWPIKKYDVSIFKSGPMKQNMR